MRQRSLLILAAFLLLGSPAWAQATKGSPSSLNAYTEPSTGTTAFSGATVGTTHGQVLGAGQVSVYLFLGNPSAAGGNTVYCRFGGTATVAGAGTISIAPGQSYTWESSYAPRDAVDCVATGASTPLTIGVQ